MCSISVTYRIYCWMSMHTNSSLRFSQPSAWCIVSAQFLHGLLLPSAYVFRIIMARFHYPSYWRGPTQVHISFAREEFHLKGTHAPFILASVGLVWVHLLHWVSVLSAPEGVHMVLCFTRFMALLSGSKGVIWNLKTRSYEFSICFPALLKCTAYWCWVEVSGSCFTELVTLLSIISF